MEQVISCWCKRWKLEMAGEMALNLRVSLEPELPAPFCATEVPEGNDLSQMV